MSKENDISLLKSALANANLIKEIIDSHAENEFNDFATHYAVLHALTLLGEIINPNSTTHESLNQIVTAPYLGENIDKLVQIRNTLSSFKYDLNLARLYQELHQSIPILIESLSSALAAAETGASYQIIPSSQTANNPVIFSLPIFTESISNKKNIGIHSHSGLTEDAKLFWLVQHLEVLTALINNEQYDKRIIYAIDHCINIIGKTLRNLEEVTINNLVAWGAEKNVIITTKNKRDDLIHIHGLFTGQITDEHQQLTISVAKNILSIREVLLKILKNDPFYFSEVYTSVEALTSLFIKDIELADFSYSFENIYTAKDENLSNFRKDYSLLIDSLTTQLNHINYAIDFYAHWLSGLRDFDSHFIYPVHCFLTKNKLEMNKKLKEFREIRDDILLISPGLNQIAPDNIGIINDNTKKQEEVEQEKSEESLTEQKDVNSEIIVTDFTAKTHEKEENVKKRKHHEMENDDTSLIRHELEKQVEVIQEQSEAISPGQKNAANQYGFFSGIDKGNCEEISIKTQEAEILPSNQTTDP